MKSVRKMIFIPYDTYLSLSSGKEVPKMEPRVVPVEPTRTEEDMEMEETQTKQPDIEFLLETFPSTLRKQVRPILSFICTWGERCISWTPDGRVCVEGKPLPCNITPYVTHMIQPGRVPDGMEVFKKAMDTIHLPQRLLQTTPCIRKWIKLYK